MCPSKSRNRRPRKKKSHTKTIILVVAVLAVIIGSIVVYSMTNNTSANEEQQDETPELTQTKVLLETSMGNITIQLRDDMPITTGNFRNLVNEGVYDNTIFHRVIADFMIQGGDPNGNGLSDDGIATVADEFSDTNENNRGTIAMAKLGDSSGQPVENSASSQFYINVVDNNGLDAGYSVFGDVISGMSVVDAISNVATDSNDRPLEDITLIKATLID
jgi:peptidylprolyl isomerase